MFLRQKQYQAFVFFCSLPHNCLQHLLSKQHREIKFPTLCCAMLCLCSAFVNTSSRYAGRTQRSPTSVFNIQVMESVRLPLQMFFCSLKGRFVQVYTEGWQARGESLTGVLKAIGQTCLFLVYTYSVLHKSYLKCLSHCQQCWCFPCEMSYCFKQVAGYS